MNNKIILILFAILLIPVYFIFEQLTPDNKTWKYSEINTTANIGNAQKELDRKATALKPKLKQVEYSVEAEEMLLVLEPLTFDELESKWDEQYGCYKYGVDQVDKSLLLEDECTDQLLNAKTFEEALWMQRQGYPTKSQLQLINDQANIEALLELANNKIPLAAALVTIAAIRTEQANPAVLWAAEYGALVSKENSFQYRLIGEAHMIANSDSMGLAELQIAALLGDSQSSNLFLYYAKNRSMLIESAINHAHLVMGRIFGVPMEHYPKDPRPKSWVD